MASYDDDFDFKNETGKNSASNGGDATNTRWTQEAWTNAERPLTPFDNSLKNLMIEKVHSMFKINDDVQNEISHRALGDSFIKLLCERLQKEKIIPIQSFPVEKGKKQVEKKADIIKKQNSWEIVNKELDNLFGSFKFDDDFHVPNALNSKYIEIRGVGFVVCAQYLIKNSRKFVGKKSTILFVNNIIVGMQKFINATRNLISQSIQNPLQSIKPSDKFLDIMTDILIQVKNIYSFDGMNICKNTPQLLIYTSFDSYIPTKSLSLYPHQKQLIEELGTAIKNNDPLIITLRTMTNTGKTTSALGVAEIVNCVRKYTENKDLMFIFCCNIRQVMDQVSQLVYNSSITFAIAYIDRFKGLTEIKNFNCPKNDKPCVTVCGPDSCIELVKKYPNSVIFIDEPNIGLDKGTDIAHKNVRLITEGLSKQVILSSATFFEELPNWILENHKSKYGNTKHVDIYSNKIHIACEIKTFDGKLIVPHSNAKTSDRLKDTITRIIGNPFLGRTYTANLTDNLYNISTKNSVQGLPDIAKIFDDAENLNADSLRSVCMKMLDKISECDNETIKKTCNTEITPASIQYVDEKINNSEIQWEREQKFMIEHKIDFSTLCTTSAHRFMMPTLIATENPVAFVMQYFRNIVSDFLNQYSSVKKINDDYGHNLSMWQKQIDRADRGIKDTSINSKEDRLRYEESIQLGKPTIKVSEFQINTIMHVRKYAKSTKNVIERHMLRQELDVTEIMTCEMYVPEDIRILLACGVGIVGVYGGKYAHIVNVLMNEGKLSYIVANDSIAYGTNVPINIVFVTKEFSDKHSINTIYQLISRAGRVGRSWNAEAFVDESCSQKMLTSLNVDFEKENIEFINFEKIHAEIVESSTEFDAKLIFELAEKKIKEYEEKIKRDGEIARIEQQKKRNEEIEKMRVENDMKALETLRSKRNQKTVPLSNVISSPPTKSVSVVPVTPNPVASGFKRTSIGNNRRIPEKSLFEKMQDIQKKNQS